MRLFGAHLMAVRAVEIDNLLNSLFLHARARCRRPTALLIRWYGEFIPLRPTATYDGLSSAYILKPTWDFLSFLHC